MGEVAPARTSPTLHPPSPLTVHQLLWLALLELSTGDKWYMVCFSKTNSLLCCILTLKVLVAIIDAQWDGMGM